MRANSFLVSLASLVLHKMLCGSFRESKEKTQKKLKMDNVDASTFIKTLEIWCGKDDCNELEMGDALQLVHGGCVCCGGCVA